MKIKDSQAYRQFVNDIKSFHEKTITGQLSAPGAFSKNKLAAQQQKPAEIQQMLDKLKQIQEANDRQLEEAAAEKIAKKIARGDNISEEERRYLEEKDPEKLRKAQEANRERAEVSERLSRAKTKAEAAVIIASAKTRAIRIFEKVDTELGELLIEALNKAESDYLQQKKPKRAPAADISAASQTADNQPPPFDVRL